MFKVLLSFSLTMAFVSHAYVAPLKAQPIPEDVNRQAERVQERFEEERRQRLDDLEQQQRQAPSGQIITSPQSSAEKTDECIDVKTVTIKGLTVYSQDSFDDEKQKLEGRCVNISDINELLRFITNRYVSDGYVTSRVLIAPQNSSDGNLEIVVVEGHLSEIKADSQDFGKSELNAAFPGLKGKLLNLRDIEQGIDQMLRLPSFNPSIDIEPGSAPGTSALVIKRQKAARFIRPSFSFNNQGQQSTGRLQGTFSIDIDNLTGLLDYTSLYYSRDLGTSANGGTQAAGGFVSIPRGYWTLNLSGGYSEYESILTGSGQSFVSDGQTYNGSVTLDRLFFRDSDTKVSTSVGLSLFDTVNNIQGIRLATSSYRLVAANVEARLQQRTKKGLFNASVAFVQGVDILGAETVDTGPGGAGTGFSKFSANLSYREPFELAGLKFQYALSARGQIALNPVFPAQRISVGGSSTVRGFRDDGNSGRAGAIVRQQLSLGLGEPLKTIGPSFSPRLSGFVAYDAGGIFARDDDPFERGFLHSSTFGLQINSKHIQAEVGMSIPISAPSFVDKSDVEFGANVRFSF